MKFPRLPIGQAFSYQGESYVKTGQVTGRNPAAGALRMIPRSALVEPLQTAAEPEREQLRPLDPGAVRFALDALEDRLLSGIASIDPRRQEDLDALL